MMAGKTATTSRVREHKEIPSNSSNIDRQYHQHHHQHHHEHQHLTTQSNKQSQQQQQQQSTKSSRLLSSSISTSVEQPSSLPQQGCSSSNSSMNTNRRNKLSQHHTRFTSHINPMSPTSASSVSDVVASNSSVMPPSSLPLQDKTDIFHLHHIDQAHSSNSTIINSSVNTTSTTTSSNIYTQHMKSQPQGQTQVQHFQMLRGRHKEDAIVSDKLEYATSSFTNVDDLTNAIRNKVIVEEDEEDIMSSDNTYLY